MESKIKKHLNVSSHSARWIKLSATFWTSATFYTFVFLLTFFGLLGIIAFGLTSVSSEEGMDEPIRPYIYNLRSETQQKVVKKLGVQSFIDKRLKKKKVNQNVTFRFELAFGQRIMSSDHLVSSPDSADLLFAEFFPSITEYCYFVERCQGDVFEDSFLDSVKAFGRLVEEVDDSIPVFVGIGESDPRLMSLLVSIWRRNLTFITSYMLESEKLTVEVGEWSYTTVSMALPDMGKCGNRCMKRLIKENRSVSAELLRKEEEENFEAKTVENRSLSEHIGDTLYKLVYTSSERKKWRVLLATGNQKYQGYVKEAKSSKKLMKAVNLSSSLTRKVLDRSRRLHRSYLKSSRFCVHLFEDIRDVSGFFAGVSGGCIPIVSKSHKWRHPYADSYKWDYSRFSFVVDFDQVPSILDYIDSLSEYEIEKKQYALFMVKRRVSWFSTTRYRKQVNTRDAFDLTILEVFFRAVLQPRRLRLQGLCHSLSFAFPRVTKMEHLLQPEVATFLQTCYNITVTPNDFLVNWLDLNYNKQEL